MPAGPGHRRCGTRAFGQETEQLLADPGHVDRQDQYGAVVTRGPQPGRAGTEGRQRSAARRVLPHRSQLRPARSDLEDGVGYGSEDGGGPVDEPPPAYFEEG